MNVAELKNLDIGQQFIDAWQSRGIGELTEIQNTAFNNVSLLRGDNVLIIAPTSSGKTFIGEVLAVHAASTLHRAIYLLPFKALAEEKYIEFSETYRDLGISIVVSSGDHSEYDTDIRRGDFGLAIIVYEKLAQLLVQSPGIISDCHLMVIDEVQMIRERARGPLLEMLLTRIKRLQPSPQIICLSATVSDSGGLDSWLGAKVIEVTNRPVPLWECVLEEPGTVTVHNVADKQTETRDLGLHVPVSDKETMLDALIKGLTPEQQMLVFRTQVDATERTASKLAQLLPVRLVSGDVRERIMSLEDSPLRSFLERNIERRIAYHNAGLSVEERRLVEALFQEGVLQVIVATATLAAGVNLPADIVVVADHRRYDFGQRTMLAIDVAEYKNCAGRAGRLGKRTAGTSVLLTEVAGQTKILENAYIYGDLPRLESAIPMQADLAQHVLGVIAEQLADTKSDVTALFRDSFAFFTYYQPNGYETQLVEAIGSAIEQLLALGLVEEQDERLKVTSLGRVAARSGVAINTFGVLAELVRSGSLDSLSEREVLSSITSVYEMERCRPFAALQRAELLSGWISGESTMALARDYSTTRYSVGHGRIRELGEVAEWLLLTTAQIGSAMSMPGTVVEKLTQLAGEAHYGVPTELVELARLRVLPRSDLLRLAINDKGIKLTDPHEILDAEPGRFVGILAPQKATALKERIARSIGETLRRRKVGHLLRCDKLAAIRPLVERVYDAHGTDFDRALEDLLNAPLVELGVRRFTRQRSGQPDLELIAARGTVVMSATAAQDDQKPVSWDKSREVLGSVGYSGNASNFVVIGKPDFHSIAIDNTIEILSKGEHLLLVPVDVVVELCIQKIEGKISREDLISKLEDTRGYLKREDVEALTYDL